MLSHIRCPFCWRIKDIARLALELGLAVFALEGRTCPRLIILKRIWVKIHVAHCLHTQHALVLRPVGGCEADRRTLVAYKPSLVAPVIFLLVFIPMLRWKDFAASATPVVATFQCKSGETFPAKFACITCNLLLHCSRRLGCARRSRTRAVRSLAFKAACPAALRNVLPVKLCGGRHPEGLHRVRIVHCLRKITARTKKLLTSASSGPLPWTACRQWLRRFPSSIPRALHLT